MTVWKAVILVIGLNYKLLLFLYENNWTINFQYILYFTASMLLLARCQPLLVLELQMVPLSPHLSPVNNWCWYFSPLWFTILGSKWRITIHNSDSQLTNKVAHSNAYGPLLPFWSNDFSISLIGCNVLIVITIHQWWWMF